MEPKITPAKKSSTKMIKARNKLKALSLGNAKKKAQKAVRNLIKQKTVGKSKDLGAMSMGQKVALDKKVDKRMKSTGRHSCRIFRQEKTRKKNKWEKVRAQSITQRTQRLGKRRMLIIGFIKEDLPK